MVVAGYGFYYFKHRASAPAKTNSTLAANAINSIAVLPFEDDTATPDSEYLSDGLTESLMSDLSLMPHLRVIARSSVFRYKNRNVDAQTVGRELNVQAVLMGHIKQHGAEIMVTAELINALDNSLIWTGQYPQKTQTLLDIEQRISRAIGEKLQSRVSSKENTSLPRRNTQDDEAYHLYLKGRYSLNKRTNPRLAVDYFQQAIDRDPAYAQAFAGLADAYTAIGLGLYEGPPPLEIMPKAKAAALKALEIDDTLAEAHVSLALTKMQFDFDWPAAENEFKRAIALNPNYAPAYQWFVLYHLIMSRFDDALADARKAQELDPLSLVIYTNIGRTLYYSRKYDLAIEQLKSALEMDKNLLSARILLGLCYENKKMYKEAIAEYTATLPLTNNAPWSLAALGHAYAVSGRRNDALKIIEQLKSQPAKPYVSPFHIGAIYNGLGDKDRAFEWFEKAYADRSGLLIYIKIEPEFDGLRTNPKYLDLMRRIGLEK
jgi:TolB-like protein